MSRPSKSPHLRFTLKAVLVSLLVLGPMVLFFHRYSFGVDAQKVGCLPFKYYLLDTGNVHVHKGQYVAFRTDSRVKKFPRGSLFVKQVVGQEGDRVTINDGRVFINGKYLKTASMHVLNKLNESMSDLDASYTLGKGELFGTATHPDSYDSTYWGAIEPAQVVGEIYPIF